MNSKAWIFVALFAFCELAAGHKYKSGECPQVEPMQGFDMRKFLGVWFAIQKTSTASECVVYNISQVEPGQYLIQQLSQDYLIGLAPVLHRYSYTGELDVKDVDVPAKLIAKFPLNVLPGDAIFKVFMTDYENYAGIFTCQKLPVSHRQSATILSRSKDMDKAYVDKIRTRLNSYGVDAFDLSIINQSNCPSLSRETKINIDIRPETFSSENIGKWVRKAGEKIGDGVEWTVDKAKMIYRKVSGSYDERKENANKLTEGEKPVWMP